MSRVAASLAVVMAGVACLVVAAFFADWRVGLAVVGVLLVVVGYFADVPPSQPDGFRE